MKLLLVDNYDSFTHNVAQLFGALGASVSIVRNDAAALDDEAPGRFDAVCIGPGPGRPGDAGRSLRVIRRCLAERRPLLGVCLGMQAIAEACGGRVVHAPSLMHGKTSEIEHDGTGVFAGLPRAFVATRYHSLCVARNDFPRELRPNASTDDGVVQGLAHRSLPFHGVQFHPESVLTTEGPALFANFLAMARS